MPINLAALTDLDQLLRAVGAAEIMPRFRRLAAGQVRRKSGPLDLVTDADEAAEAALEAGLRARYPDALVVGEEAASADPRLLDALAQADLAFLLDPIDGTANYAAGMPLFGVMLAVLRRGEIIAAIIHDPVTGESALALRGQGAWLEQADGQRSDLRVAAPVALAQMTGAASWRFFAPREQQRLLSGLPQVAAVWDFRCAAHVYRLAAAGGCHFLLFNRLLPWDHAPGWLLHREAGGYAAQIDGGGYDVRVHRGGLICAPDRESWEILRAALFG